MADDLQPTAAQHERRTSARIPCNLEGSLLLIHQNSFIPCTLVDLSLGGCRIRTENRFLAGPMVRVEVCLRSRGASLRLPGVTQWTDRKQAAGIRFIDMTPHRIETLTDFLAVFTQTLPSAPQTRPSENDREFAAQSAPARPSAGKLVHLPARGARVDPSPNLPATSASRPSRPKAASGRGEAERRASQRYPVDTSATVHLLNIASRIDGQILDLSLSGCRIRTKKPFPVGIFRRVETEFRVHGLPFRLAGVTQSLHDRTTVGIRFLDMSARKREQLQQLIHEMEEDRADEQRRNSGGENPSDDEGKEDRDNDR